jgi:hypothetical protein
MPARAAVRSDSRATRARPIIVSLRLVRFVSSLVIAAQVAAPLPAFAGAWLRAPGETYVKASFFLGHGVDQFDGGGGVGPLFLYAEYGVSRDLTLFADGLLKVADLKSIDRRVAFDVGGVSFGIPGVRLGARLPVARGRVRAALEPSVTLPLEALGRSQSGARPLGTPSAALALAASVGAAVPLMQAYAQGSAGYRARAGREPGEWFGDVEAGVAPFGPLRARVRIDAVNARAEASAGTGAQRMAVPEAGGQDLRRVAPTLAIAWGGGTEFSLTWRRAIGGRSALRTSEWEFAYSFLGGGASP